MKHSQSVGEIETFKLLNPGWSKDFKTYTLGRTMFGEQGKLLDADDNGYSESLKPSGYEAEERKTSLDIRNVNPVWEMVWSAAFVGPLLRPLEQRSRILSIWGKTYNGKSVLQAHLAAVNGYYPIAKIQASASESAYNPLLAARNDGVAWLDDTATLSKSEFNQKLSYIVSNEASPDRAKQDGKLRPNYFWRVLACVSGEDPFVDTGTKNGAINRAIEFHVEKAVDDSRLQHWYGQLAEHYGHIGRTYIEKLVEYMQQPDAASRLRARLRSITNDLMRDDHGTLMGESWISHMGILALANAMARELVWGENSIDAEERAVAACKGAMDNARIEREDIGTRENDKVEMFLSWLRQEQKHFQDGEDDAAFNCPPYYGRRNVSVYGIPCTQVLPTVMRRFYKEFGGTPRTFTKMLLNSGWLIPCNDGSLSISARNTQTSVTTRFYCIRDRLADDSVT